MARKFQGVLGATKVNYTVRHIHLTIVDSALKEAA